MKKYDFITCMNLHKILKTKIKGGIFISINNGQLSVNINSKKGMKYKSYIDELPRRKEQIQLYADSIEKDYKQFIMEQYFI